MDVTDIKTMTQSQINMLTDLCFEVNPYNNTNWVKLYRKRGYIIIYLYTTLPTYRVITSQIKTCGEAQHDIDMLKKCGLLNENSIITSIKEYEREMKK